MTPVALWVVLSRCEPVDLHKELTIPLVMAERLVALAQHRVALSKRRAENDNWRAE